MSRNRSGLLHLSISWVKGAVMTEELVILVSQELQDLGSDLPKSFCKLFLRRLEALGCPVTEEEESFALAFAARKTEVEILDYCHIDLIPAVLYPLLCDRAAGRYLYDRKSLGLPGHFL